MSESLRCNVCESGGAFETAREVLKVPCHVRFFKDDSFTVWRCTQCGSLHSKEDVDLNNYYAHYPLKQHVLDFHTRCGYENRVRLLREAGVTPDHSVLDFGCGQGLYVHFLRDSGFKDVQGFDPFCADFKSEDVLNRQYDVVVSHDVIEHVDEPRKFMADMAKLVRPNGWLVIGTPNADEISLKRRSNLRSLQVELSQPYHRHILSERALIGLAKCFGLHAAQTYRRFYFDSLYPTVNTRFMWGYVKATGGYIDASFEPPRLAPLFTSPQLLFWAFFGYFFRTPGNILITFRRLAVASQGKPQALAANA